MNPSVWGPSAWTFLHYITLSYPKCPTEKDKYNMRIFLENLQHVLPCDTCKIHYKDNIEIHYPLTDEVLNTKENLVKWLIDLHNSVNKRIGKSILSYDEAISKYIDNNSNNDDMILIISIIGAILILILVPLIMSYYFRN